MLVASSSAVQVDRDSPYCVALLDWLACAHAGVHERAAVAVRSSGSDLLTRVAFAATAGHVHDFDDTFSEGVAHVSAACAPAALVLGAELGLSLGDSLSAYAEAFEATAGLAAAAHPALYEAGWHPTAVCGSLGAAVAAARLLGLDDAQRASAIALSMLRAGGMRGAFGSDGKAIQVGQAAAAGVQAALLARGGAVVHERALRGAVGFEGVFGVPVPVHGDVQTRAIERNWIKLHPSCLGTHSPIEAAAIVRDQSIERDALTVVVHPTARRAAHLDTPSDGLEAKFSIPYCVAHTLLAGPPKLQDFAAIDPRVRESSRLVQVDIDPALPEFGAVLIAGGRELARVPAPKGSPENPASVEAIAGKLSELAGDHLDGLLDDLGAPAANALAAARLAGV